MLKGQSIKREYCHDAQQRMLNDWSYCRKCKNPVTWTKSRAGNLVAADGHIKKPDPSNPDKTAFNKRLHSPHFLVCTSDPRFNPAKAEPAKAVQMKPVQSEREYLEQIYGQVEYLIQVNDFGQTDTRHFDNSGAALAWLRSEGFECIEPGLWECSETQRQATVSEKKKPFVFNSIELQQKSAN